MCVKGGKDKKDAGGGKESAAAVPLNKDKSIAPVNIYKGMRSSNGRISKLQHHMRPIFTSSHGHGAGTPPPPPPAVLLLLPPL